MRLKFLVAAAAGSMLLAGCGITNGEVDAITLPDVEVNTLQVMVDTATYTATGKSAVVAGRSTDSFSLSARVSNGGRLSINLSGVSKPGTYSLNMDGDGAAAYLLGSASWNSAIAGGSGTITFTTFSLVRAVGTFSFLGAPVAGTTATGAKLVSSGVFDVSFGTQ